MIEQLNSFNLCSFTIDYVWDFAFLFGRDWIHPMYLWVGSGIGYIHTIADYKRKNDDLNYDLNPIVSNVCHRDGLCFFKVPPLFGMLCKSGTHVKGIGFIGFTSNA